MDPAVIAQLSASVAGDDPVGPDLEYDEAMIGLVDTVKTPAVADWSTVRQVCADLLQRTQDLRVAAIWTRASMHLDGIEGLLAGLSLCDALLARHGDALHPRRDPDDGDAYARRAALISWENPEHLQNLLQLSAGDASGPSLAEVELWWSSANLPRQQACLERLSALPDDQRALSHWPLIHATLLRIFAAGKRLCGLQSGDLQALLDLSVLMNHVATAAARGADASLTSPLLHWAPVSDADLVALMQRVRERVTALHPSHAAALLLQRAERLLNGNVRPS